MIIIDAIIGYIIAHYVAGKKEGEQGRIRSLRFRILNYKIHLHHWFVCTLAIGGLVLVGTSSTWMYGILAGSVMHGLTYNDFHRIIYRHLEDRKDA